MSAVIWQDAAGSDRSRLVWRSSSQLHFCTEKARQLVHELIDKGWTCEAQVTGSEARSDAALTVRLERAAPNLDAALPPRAGPDADAALPLRAASEPAAPAEPARGSAAEPPRADQALLRAALERDVARLDQLAGPARRGFELEAARLGDLDGDGIEDAVALLTHSPEGAPPSHHLLAYAFEGGTFQPVARLALTRKEAVATQMELQDIVDGVIELVLHVPRPGDPACCPSGRERARFVLRDQQLVDAGKTRPGA